MDYLWTQQFKALDAALSKLNKPNNIERSDLMLIHDTSLTARQAADKFAAEHFDKPRKVGATMNSTADAALRFQLVDGVRWYSVRSLEDRTGWEVTAD
jgi:hypothetical protein